MKKEIVAKHYAVTLHPKAVTLVVFSDYPWKAVSLAEDEYASNVARGEEGGFGFDSYEVREIDDLNRKALQAGRNNNDNANQ